MQQVLPVSQLTQDPTRDPARWAMLPGLSCQAAGGEPRQADDLVLAWFLFYIAAHQFDQVEDQDPPEDGSPVWSPGVSVNLATGMLLAASFILNRLNQETKTQVKAEKIIDDFYRSLLIMCNGQHLDLMTPQPTLEQWMQIAGAKSGTFFRLACQAGAAVATDQSETLEALGDYGFRLGMLLQILDDLGDFRQVTNSGESVLSMDAGRSLAMAYAREVLPPEQRLVLSETLTNACVSAQATQQVVDLLSQCGAGLYLEIEIERQRGLGIQALHSINPQPPAGEILLSLLTDLGSDSPSVR